jgi:hypothetical protein
MIMDFLCVMISLMLYFGLPGNTAPTLRAGKQDFLGRLNEIRVSFFHNIK